MRHGLPDSAFELPPRFQLVERRMSGQALDAWLAGGGGLVAGFDNHMILVDEPGGSQRIDRVGAAVTRQFGLCQGQMLQRTTGLAEELCAACDLIALHAAPVPFETSLVTVAAAIVLVRGVALPIDDGRFAQIVLNWREVLNRAATVRLRRELAMALREGRPVQAKIDPFQ